MIRTLVALMLLVGFAGSLSAQTENPCDRVQAHLTELCGQVRPAHDSSVLPRESAEALDRIAALLRECDGQYAISVESADRSRSKRIRTSRHIGKSIHDYLLHAGVPAQRLQVSATHHRYRQSSGQPAYRLAILHAQPE